MKKIIALLLIAMLCFGLVACGEGLESTAETAETAGVSEKPEETTEEPEPESEYIEAELNGIKFLYNSQYELAGDDSSITITYEESKAFAFFQSADLGASYLDESTTLDLALAMVTQNFEDKQMEEIYDITINDTAAKGTTFVSVRSGYTFNVMSVAFSDGNLYYNVYYMYKIDDNNDNSTKYNEEFVSMLETIDFIETESLNEKDEMTFGSTFEFDGVQIQMGDTYEWVVVENQFADSNGADAIKLPITVTNLSDETHGLNMFYFTVYGSAGTKLDNISAYFDNDISWEGEMRSGATLEAYMHILYDGDGDYYIEFDNYSEKIEVKLPIAK